MSALIRVEPRAAQTPLPPCTNDVRALLDALADTVVRVRRDGKVAVASTKNSNACDSAANPAAFYELARRAWSTGAPCTVEKIVGEGDELVAWELRAIPIDANEAWGLCRDVSELKRAEQRAQRAQDAAQNASRAKGEFLATTSHEIRTPLNGVLSLIELLRRTKLDDEQLKYAQMARHSALHLLDLINDILDLSRIESGRLELEDTRFELRDAVDQAVGVVAQRAWDKGLEVETTLADNLPQFVLGDPLRLRQVIVNLLGNAVKFTSRGVLRVHVGRDVAGQCDSLRFIVSDEGEGIAAADQARIFDSFTQIQGTARKHGGSGLGLTICSRIVHAMGGTIGVESELGKGSTFHFTARLPAAVDEPAIDHGADDVRACSPRANSVVPIPLRVLIAEDSSVNRFVIRRIVEPLGHAVTVTEDGKQCFEAFTRNDFDLVLMDLEMPVMDGFDAARAIRAYEQTSGRAPAKIIALTAHALREYLDRSTEAGMDGALTKPIDVRVLELELQRVGTQVARQRRDGTPAAATPSHVDVKLAIERLGGDADLFRELAGLAAEDVPKLRDAVTIHLDAKQQKDATRAAHSMKGALGNVGATRGAELAAALEKAIVAGESSTVTACTEALDRELAFITAELSLASLAV